MAEIKLTAAQEKAVYHGDGNLLISAAAGSGKTATLSTRIAQLVIDGRGELSRMLIVTFTRASAGEMRERISKKLHEAAETHRTGDPDVRSRISKALAEVSSAEISTIHSFLYKAMKPYFGTLRISADARIAEQQVVDALKRECMKSVVDDYFDGNGDSDVNFPELADVIGRVRDSEAVDSELLWLAQTLQSCGENAASLKKYADKLNDVGDGKLDLMQAEFGLQVKRTLAEFADHYRKILEYYAEEMPWEEEVWKKYGENHGYMSRWISGLKDLLADENARYEAFRNHFAMYAPPRLGSLRGEKKTELAVKFGGHREEMKKDIGRISENFFAAAAEEASAAAMRTAEILRSASVVLEEYFRKLAQKKRSLSMLDYDDLEDLATKLFITDEGNITDVARETGGKYDYIFIDEYQDTNSVQDRIFCAVAGNATRFIVGDIKQSIYRFRGANPDVFAEYRRNWNGGENGESLFMSENFRCDSSVIDFVNLVSRHTLSKTSIPYEKADELVYAKNADHESVPVEVCLIKKEDADSENKYSPDVRERNPEAWYVAGRIREMIGRYSPDGKSILKPADVAVILRSPSSSGQDYIEALALHGVPAAMKTSKALDEYASVMLLICILRMVNNPLEDVSLAGALRSPVFGYSTDELIRIRERAGDMPLYYGINQSLDEEENGESAVYAKHTETVRWIKEQRILADGLSLEKYLEQLIESTELKTIDGVRGNGSELDAVQRLISAAKSYETGGSDGRGGISGFLEYLENVLENVESEHTDAQPDSVQIISIHSSKGLEFPVVFLSECTKQRNSQDEMRTILFDQELGLGMYLPDSTGLTRSDNLIRRAVAEKIRADSVAEEMRMLYVALTRAKNRLVVTGKIKDADAELRDAEWEAAFADAWSVGHCRNYMEWILQACSLCKNNKPYKIIEIDEKEEIDSELTETNDEKSADDGGIRDLIGGRLQWKYAWEYLENIPAKLTVSRLNPEILDEYEVNTTVQTEEAEKTDEPAKRPLFMCGKDEKAARERGNATHKFLQFVRFRELSEYGFETEKNRLITEGFLSEREANMINIQQIERFRNSTLLIKMLDSGFVKREFRFNHRMPAADFTEEAVKKQELTENAVKITVQGVVDCVFRDPDSGKLVLVDYKTDSLTAEEWKDQRKAEGKLLERHRNQLTYYAEICSELFGEIIDEVYIYSTVLGRMIRV